MSDKLNNKTIVQQMLDSKKHWASICKAHFMELWGPNIENTNSRICGQELSLIEGKHSIWVLLIQEILQWVLKLKKKEKDC